MVNGPREAAIVSIEKTDAMTASVFGGTIVIRTQDLFDVNEAL